MPARTLGALGAGTFATVAMVLSLAGSASAADGGHGLGRMGPTAARTTPVSPATGPDFELPFVCGQRWIGGSRSGHSPSSYTIDFNTSNDLGRPALASAPGVVTRAATLTGSYGRHVVVDHGGYTTLYAHLNQIVATVGTYLDQGDLVGYVGGSCDVTGPHLHFEQRKGGAYFPPYFHRTTFPRAPPARPPATTVRSRVTGTATGGPTSACSVPPRAPASSTNDVGRRRSTRGGVVRATYR
ncbi:MAG: metalloendopeptidase [Marmoricola sp.]|nr:metalloendopeptidase [Marmoricola sp.]